MNIHIGSSRKVYVFRYIVIEIAQVRFRDAINLASEWWELKKGLRSYLALYKIRKRVKKIAKKANKEWVEMNSMIKIFSIPH